MPPRILVAEDSATMRAVVRIELESAGFEVIEAIDGAQALARAVQFDPDVVLLDIEMPVMDGYQTVQALKADARTAAIPVVFLTGRVGSEDVVRALKLGGHDYLRKPLEPTELLARISSAVRVKQLQDELRARAAELDRMSRTDFLTSLYNRRHMQEHYRALLAEARRHGYPIAVLLVDVDHFKSVNDQFGHGVGDQVLQEIAGRLRASLRTEDAVGRWGGEEFLVLLPHTSTEAAGVLATRLLMVVRQTPFGHADGQVTVTVSIGGASAESPGEHDLIALADTELYVAKGAGRDQVSLVRSPG